MSRKELFLRSPSYPVNAYPFIGFVILQIFLTFKLITDKLDKDEIFMLLMTISIEIVLILIYRKYILDIILKDTETFHGKVVSFHRLPGTRMQEGIYELIAEDENLCEKFIIFPDQLERFYQTKILLQSMMNHNVHFQYLKRSRCIVAILDIDIEDTNTSKNI